MKRLMLVWLMIMCMVPLDGWAEENSPDQNPVMICGDYVYTLMEDGTAEVRGYNGTERDLIIPDTFDGHLVTRIGEEAFDVRHVRIRSVVVPEGVVSIGARAFETCDDLVEIQLPDTLIEIGDQAFRHCWCSLKSITIPDSVTVIGSNPFVECYKLTEICISPNHPRFSLIDGALFDKEEQRLIYYPAARTGHYRIPEGTRIIDGYAFFRSCLGSVTIPDSVETIGEYSFAYSDLADVVIPGSVAEISEGAFELNRSLKTAVLENGVRVIDDFAFYSCSDLTEIIMPEGMEAIGSYAFFACVQLARISIPDSVADLGDNPFTSCFALNQVDLSPEHPFLVIMNHCLISRKDDRLVCFLCTDGADSCIIPEGVRTIGERAFLVCRGLKSVTIPDDVERIGDDAFALCYELERITIPASVSEIGSDAFAGCEGMTVVLYPNTCAEQYCREQGIPYEYAEYGSLSEKEMYSEMP